MVEVELLTKLATLWIEKTEPGVVLPMPTRPFWSIMNAVEVAVAVEVEMVKSGETLEERAAMESLAHGEVVPMPIEFPKVARPVKEEVPPTESAPIVPVPIVASCEKRFVEEAVVEKSTEVVAVPRDV